MNKKKSYKVLGGMAALVAILFSSCYQPLPVDEAPLSIAKVKLILKDIHLAESMLTEVINRTEKDSLARVYYNQIFSLHEVDKEDFDESMHAYFSDPAALDSLYAKVITELAKEKNEIMGEPKVAPKKDPQNAPRE